MCQCHSLDVASKCVEFSDLGQNRGQVPEAQWPHAVYGRRGGDPRDAGHDWLWDGERSVGTIPIAEQNHSKIYSNFSAAVHQLVMSLGDWKAAGLPDSAVAFALLPVTLDTPMNRKWMPDANHST
jgi:hypothetical protein